MQSSVEWRFQTLRLSQSLVELFRLWLQLRFHSYLQDCVSVVGPHAQDLLSGQELLKCPHDLGEQGRWEQEAQHCSHL